MTPSRRDWVCGDRADQEFAEGDGPAAFEQAQLRPPACRRAIGAPAVKTALHFLKLRLYRRGGEVEFHRKLAVEPVLDLRAPANNAGFVPLAGAMAKKEAGRWLAREPTSDAPSES